MELCSRLCMIDMAQRIGNLQVERVDESVSNNCASSTSDRITPWGERVDLGLTSHRGRDSGCV